MTSATTFNGIGSVEKPTSRVLQPPGGGGSSVLPSGPSVNRDKQANQRRVNERPSTGYQTQAKAATHESWNAGMVNKQRNMARDAPFATTSSMINNPGGPMDEGPPSAPSGGESWPHTTRAEDAMDGQHLAGAVMGEGPPMGGADASGGRVLAKGPVSDFNPINWSAREGEAAPMELVAHENYASVDPLALNAPVRMKGKAATHNPLTWEAYSNFDADCDLPAQKSRYQGNEGLKKGTYNPITGEDYQGPPPASQLVLGHTSKGHPMA